MAPKIQIKRGSKAGLPTLSPGEFGLATDTKELFVGTAEGNVQIAALGSDGKVPESLLPEMDYIPSSEKGQANGVATLGSDGKIPGGQLPSILSATAQITYNGGDT